MKFFLAAFAILLLALWSVFVGVSDLSPGALFSSGASDRAMQVLVISRIPRTLAVLLAGASMAVAGLIMQILARNRFVEPSTAGTVEFATLGLLTATLLAPATPVFGKMLVAAAFALMGTALLPLDD